MSDAAPTASAASRTADPGLIGLLGFVIGTLTAQLAHLGIQSENAVFWVGAAFGGIVQVTAGMLCYFIGDDFHFIVYNAFGWYWICMPGFMLGGELGIFEVSGPGRPIFMLIFSILGFAFAIAGSMHNSVLPRTLLCVGIGLGLEALGEFAMNHTAVSAGAWFLIAASALATYMLIEKFYWRTMGRHILPLGPAWLPGSGDVES